MINAGAESKEKMKYKISFHENEKISNTVATEVMLSKNTKVVLWC